MRVHPATRRRLVAIELVAERRRLEVFLAALGYHAIRAYAGEPIAEAWPHIETTLEELIRSVADAGAFEYFGIRDAGDLLGLPAMLYPGGVVGAVGVEVNALARMIMAGGSRRAWVRPRDLVLSGGDR